MNVVDSSGWIEFATEGRNAGFFEKPIRDVRRLIVPTITVFEVFKRVQQIRDVGAAELVLGVMMGARIVDLSTELAVAAAELSLELKLPMADSLILATARACDATLWTQDADFEGVPGVKYRPKRRPEARPSRPPADAARSAPLRRRT